MDLRVREAQRQFEASGNPQDGAQWLRLRMAAGELVGDQIEMAARLGYPPAKLIYPGKSLCDGLDEESADNIADEWADILNRFPVLYAAMLFLCRGILLELREQNDEPVGLDVLAVIFNECCTAFGAGQKFLVDARGDILLGWAAGDRNQLHFGIMAVFNLAEAWSAHEMDITEMVKNHSKICLYNCIEFSTYTTEVRCQELSQFLIPWILSEFPPIPATVAEQLSLNQE
mgnify:CR=1 FL=1